MMERPASPKEVAAKVGEPIGKVSYHVRELHRAGLIELVETRRRRGATEHFYRGPYVPLIPTDEWGQLDPEQRRFVSTLVIHLILADLGISLDADLFDARVDRHLSRVTFRLDEEGWRELHDLYDEALASTLAIRQRSKERLASRDERGTLGTAALVSFQRPELP